MTPSAHSAHAGTFRVLRESSHAVAVFRDPYNPTPATQAASRAPPVGIKTTVHVSSVRRVTTRLMRRRLDASRAPCAFRGDTLLHRATQSSIGHAQTAASGHFHRHRTTRRACFARMDSFSRPRASRSAGNAVNVRRERFVCRAAAPIGPTPIAVHVRTTCTCSPGNAFYARVALQACTSSPNAPRATTRSVFLVPVARFSQIGHMTRTAVSFVLLDGSK